MEKKPKLLDKKKLIISCNSPINLKVLDHSLKSLGEYEAVTENELPKFLARIFMFEPKLVIIAHEDLEENLEFARHIRLNPSFSDLPVICISAPPKKENSRTGKKITNLKINYFMIPLNNTELTKVIKQFLEN
jgi:CheY-like chemotaxis protein